MQYVLTIRNHTHYFGIHNLHAALERPEGVGLLSVSNHVTTIDSASLPTPLIQFSRVWSVDTNLCRTAPQSS